MSNRMQELILLLEDEIDRSPKQRLSSGNKRMVDCDRLLDLLGDLKVVIPEEVRQAQAVLSERDALLHEAQSEATAVVARARVEAERLVANNKTVAEAKARAMTIMTRAEENADAIMQGARDYSQTVMEEVQRYLQQYMEQIDDTREELRRNYRPLETMGTVYDRRTVEPPPIQEITTDILQPWSEKLEETTGQNERPSEKKRTRSGRNVSEITGATTRFEYFGGEEERRSSN